MPKERKPKSSFLPHMCTHRLHFPILTLSPTSPLSIKRCPSLYTLCLFRVVSLSLFLLLPSISWTRRRDSFTTTNLRLWCAVEWTGQPLRRAVEYLPFPFGCSLDYEINGILPTNLVDRFYHQQRTRSRPANDWPRFFCAFLPSRPRLSLDCRCNININQTKLPFKLYTVTSSPHWREFCSFHIHLRHTIIAYAVYSKRLTVQRERSTCWWPK